MQLPPQRVTFREMADDITYSVLPLQFFCKSKIISKILQKKLERRGKKRRGERRREVLLCRRGRQHVVGKVGPHMQRPQTVFVAEE